MTSYDDSKKKRKKKFPSDLILIRHGQSEGNYAKEMDSVYGTKEYSHLLQQEKPSSYEYRLTPTGIAQARATGIWIRKHISPTFDFYFVSDLLRAKETAAHLEFPDAQWDTETSIREQYCCTSSRERKQSFVQERMVGIQQFLFHLFQVAAGKKVVVVCHATTIRSFIIHLEGLQYRNMTRLKDYPILNIENCQVVWYSHNKEYDRSSTRYVYFNQRISLNSHDRLAVDISKKELAKKSVRIDGHVLSNEDLLQDVERSPSIEFSTLEEKKIKQFI